MHEAQAAAAIEIHSWFKAHRVAVERALAWFGVTDREDRVDLTQEVFLSAYRALLRGEQIEHPRAWLREHARNHAINYRRKKRRRSLPIDGDPLIYRNDPSSSCPIAKG